MNLQTIDRLRLAAGMSVSELSKRAGVAYSTYWFIRTGRVKPMRKTLEKYAAGLSASPKVKPRAPFDELALAAYRGHVAAISAKLGADPAEVVASIPSRSATQDAKWALAAKVRSLAIYCTVVEFNLPGAVLARAIGMTKQAVSWNLKRVEDLRDDPTVDDIIESVGRLIAAREA